MEEESYTSTHPLDHTGPVMGSLYLIPFIIIIIIITIIITLHCSFLIGVIQPWCIDMVVNRTVPPVQLASWLGFWSLFLIQRFPSFFATTRAAYSCALFSMFHGFKKWEKVKIWCGGIKRWIAIVFLAPTFAPCHGKPVLPSAVQVRASLL